MKLLSVLMVFMSLNVSAKDSELKELVDQFESKALMSKSLTYKQIDELGIHSLIEETENIRTANSINKLREELQKEIASKDSITNEAKINIIENQIRLEKVIYWNRIGNMTNIDLDIYGIEKEFSAEIEQIIKDGRALKTKYKISCGIEKEKDHFVFRVNDETFLSSNSLDSLNKEIGMNYSYSFVALDCKNYQPVNMVNIIESIYKLPEYVLYEAKGHEFDADRETANNLEQEFADVHKQFEHATEYSKTYLE